MLAKPCWRHPAHTYRKLKGGQRGHVLGTELAGTWVLGLMAASPSAAGGARGLGQSQDMSPPSSAPLWAAHWAFTQIFLCLTSLWQMLPSRGGDTGIERQLIRFDGSLLRGNPLDSCPGQIRLRGLNSQGRHRCTRSKPAPRPSPQRHHLQP